MFIQIVQGVAADEAAMRRQWDRWLADVAGGAIGWLGSTAGVAADGRFVAAARFESEEAAAANSARPEQGAWWQETSRHLERPSFVDCREVDVVLTGGSDDAGFVQFMHAGVRDRARMRAIEEEAADRLAELRPDLLGALRAWHPDGPVTAIDYFTSEADARKGESQELPPDDAALFAEWMSLIEGPEFIDLPSPWLARP
ncbi:MAG: hypothetical protein M3Q48_00490 [Actinomycetota bacterium]|nr:hypothetical protein [Actinomycetota bacterium]